MDILNRLKSNKTLLNGTLFSIYSFFNDGIAFLLLFLLANYIAPAEYGRLSLYNTIVQFLGYVIALSTQGFLSVSYFKRGQNYFKKDLSTISFICVCGAVLFCILTFFLGKWISNKAELPILFLWVAIAVSFFQIFQGMWLNYHRIKEEIGKYGIISCSAAIFNLILSLYLVIEAGQNWTGRVYAQLICTSLYGIIGILVFAHHKLFTRKIDLQNIKMIAMWGIPLIPHLASVWLKQGGDRFIINHFHSVEDVGLFSFALNLTSVIIIIGSAFNSSNSVTIFKILADSISVKEKLLQLRRQTRNISFILIAASVCVIIGGSILVPIFLPRYTSSIPYFLILSIQGIGQCFYFLFCNYLFYYSKNKQIMYITFLTAIFHLSLSILLTKYSLFYTCIIYVVTQIIVTGLVYIYSQRLLKEKLSI